MPSKPKIYTVGHSTQPFERFLRLLRRNQITAVADVRSSPYSRYAPQFDKETLKIELKREDVAYVFLGAELGARSDDNSCYVGNTVSYEKLAQTSLFRRGIQRLEDGSARHSVALMCSEQDPTHCHRTILISKFLSERGFEISHILGTGELETHRETMLRVLDILKPRERMFAGNMLFSEEEQIELAYKEGEKKFAYRREG